jgi:hypothetical protein
MGRAAAVIVMAAIGLIGCVSAPLRPEGADLPWVYGHFCGKSYPQLGGDTPEEKLAALSAITPADSIDAACQAHDRCYLEQGMHTLRCDDALVRAVYAMRFDGPQRKACARLADQIGRFFACAMPSTGEGADAWIGALKPITGMHPLCPGFSTNDLINALRAAPMPGQCIARPAR